MLLLLILNYTGFGDKIAGIASSRDLAQFQGTDPRFAYSSVFVLASALAIPASYFELADNGVAPDMGFYVGLLAFAACVLGGMGSLLRPIIASFALAVLVEVAQSTGTLSDRLWWVGLVIIAIFMSACRRVFFRQRQIRLGMDTGK